MEVHHHPHVEKKKFKEYFLEFLMIFLAVTMGFFAENVRENLANSNSGKEYMRSMIEDLKEDTTNINLVVHQNENIIRGLDTLVACMSKPLYNDSNISLAYAYCMKYRFYTPEVAFAERTMSQLKNNGGLRLIKKKNVSDALSVYDEGIRGCDRQRDMILYYYHMLDETEVNIFYFEPVKPLYNSFIKMNVDTLSIKTILTYTKGNLKIKDENEIEKYINLIMYEQQTIGLYLYNDLGLQKQKAISLINLIQSEYNLKDE